MTADDRWGFQKVSSRLKADAIVHCAPEALLAPEVSLGRFHGDVPQQKLDLLQLTARGMTQASAGAPTIVRRQLRDTSPTGVLLDDVPNHLLCDAFSPHVSLFGYAAEDPPVRDARRFKPEIGGRFNPIRHWNGPDVRRLADQVGNDPVVLPLLKVIRPQSSHFASAQAATEHERQHGSVPATLNRNRATRTSLLLQATAPPWP